jgi:hypothetical protein
MSDERMAEIESRLAALEAVAHRPIDLAALVVERAELVARLLEADAHHFSSPCSTCRSVSSLLGRPFGCSARAR